MIAHAVAGLVNPSLQPKEHKEITVNPKLFDGYVGKYQLAPDFILTITRQGDHLFAQATGQGMFPIFPEGGRDFFVKVVDAQITFVTDSQGRATKLILHQNGDNPAKANRVDSSVLPPPPSHNGGMVSMKIGVIGTGNMGRALGLRWASNGHQVLFCSRDLSKAKAVAATGPSSTQAGNFDQAAAFGEVVLHTVRDVSPSRLFREPQVLSGKIVVDCNNSDLPNDFLR